MSEYKDGRGDYYLAAGLDESLVLLENPEHPRTDNTPAFWEGWHAALAAVRVALAAAQQREGADYAGLPAEPGEPTFGVQYAAQQREGAGEETA